MSLRRSTLATACLLALGLNASAIGDALAGDGCARMQAQAAQPTGQASMPYGPAHSPLPAGAQRMPARGAPMLHPTVYWGGQPPRLVQASTAGDVPAKDIVDVAVGAGSFDTLVQAVQAAGLVETLKGEGPFTVFAPTDEAFAKIPEDQLEALLADKEALTAVLTYHVVPGKVMAADVVELDSAETVQGGSIAIDTTDGVKVDGAKVVTTDIAASNGVIHVIDRVIMPN
ncbi:fasciclin domain-containing protein [Thiohalocapsa halophila]|jgi:uncharacterized surface protein with fasciclin (FAS1) repeats